VWCNPPYGRGILEWVRKATDSIEVGDAELVVMLLPARTDTKWFHAECVGRTEIRFIQGRLTFGDAENAAPFPSMVVIWRAETSGPYHWATVNT
jgi:site-specific DNA-methyltransferase (adenine-specific)